MEGTYCVGSVSGSGSHIMCDPSRIPIPKPSFSYKKRNGVIQN